MSDLLELLVPLGLARVVEFQVRGRVVGVEIGLIDARRLYAWMDGYDPAYKNLGLGKIAVADGIRWSIETGRELFDFMVGDESYKYWFGAEDRYCDWIMLGTGLPRSRVTLLTSAVRERALGIA
jgi:CelD/BcsL family acetyltransferase involved in cellulose biosynthesis